MRVLLWLMILITFSISCNKPHRETACDDAIFLKDTYKQGIVSGYFYLRTDTIWQATYCGAQLDSLYNIVAPYDVINVDSLFTFRFVFKNHGF
jgi:hypothetical protein